MGRLIRNVFRLTLFLAIVGGGALAWTYYRSDELLKAEVLRQLGKIFPNAVLSLERTNFDLQGRIRLFDLVIRTPDDERPLLSIAETTIAVDQEQFTEHQRLAKASGAESMLRPASASPNCAWCGLRMGAGTGPNCSSSPLRSAAPRPTLNWCMGASKSCCPTSPHRP